MNNYKVIVSLITISIWIGLVLSFYQIAKNNPSINESLVLATTVQPETFTELYFEDHLNLPKTIEHAKLYNFAFTIHNLENKDTTYPYTVSLQRDGFKQIIEEGIAQINNDQSQTINITIGPLNDKPKKVVIELANKNQIISFLMNKNEKN